jgi:hypothetical protein
MTLDTLLPPHYWNFIFQMLSVIAAVFVLWQINTSKQVDGLRHSQHPSPWFAVRRMAMFLKLLALMWTVIYVHDRAWQIWPPIVAFMAAFDVYILSEVLIMREDLKKLRRINDSTSPLAA